MLKKLRRFIVRLLLLPALLIAVVFGAGVLSNKEAHGSVADFRQQIDIGTNNYRASQGLGRLTYDSNLEAIAQAWAEKLANNSEYFHNPNLSKQVFADNTYRSVAENLVAQRENGTIALQAWVGSDGHRANLLGNYNRQGIGVAYGGKYDITYVQVLAFKDAPAPQPQPQPEQPAQSPSKTEDTEREASATADPASESKETATPDLPERKTYPPVEMTRNYETPTDALTTTSSVSGADEEAGEATEDTLSDALTISSFIIPITATGLFLLFVLMVVFLKRRGE